MQEKKAPERKRMENHQNSLPMQIRESLPVIVATLLVFLISNTRVIVKFIVAAG